MQKRNKIVPTPMLKKYLFEFAVRVIIFLAVLVCYLTNKEGLFRLVNRPFWNGVTLLHALWAFFMVMMITHLFPTEKLSMAIRKSRKQEFVPVPDASREKLFDFVQQQNVRAWVVMLVWLCFNSIFGILYLLGIIDNVDLLMLTVFYFLCDHICILFYCPFQSHIMKNRCCVNCRIYEWGHFMMFTPMLFIRGFFSWSLFFTSCVVLIKWEIRYARHPERFWSGSNQNLRCENCQDKICQLKRALNPKY